MRTRTTNHSRKVHESIESAAYGREAAASHTDGRLRGKISRVKPSTGNLGAVPIYDEQRFPHIANILCKHHGMTDAQLAQVFGVSIRTLAHWKAVYPEFYTAVQEGKDSYDTDNVEQMLLKRCLGYTYKERTTKKVWINSKDAEGNDIKLPAREISETIKEVAPDVKAITFWLTNRNADRWKMITNIKADIKKTEGGSSVSVSVSSLENLNTEQLLALRDMVALQSGNATTGSKPIEIPYEEVLEKAQAVLTHTERGNTEDAEYC